MKPVACANDYSPAEIMAVTAAREIKNGDMIFVGIGIPMIAGFLAIHTHCPKTTLVFEGGYVGGRPPSVCTDVGDSALACRAPYITSMWRIFSDLQRGYCDIAIIGCAQVDKFGNVNSTAIIQDRTLRNPLIRLPGSGGANDMASSASRVLIMARLERRTFVPRVDYITSPGYIDGSTSRQRLGLKGGGPTAVITDKAVFRFDELTKEMYLHSIYPGIRLDEVKKQVCWKPKWPAKLVWPNLQRKQKLTS